MSTKLPFAILSRQIRPDAVWKVWQKCKTAEDRDKKVIELNTRFKGKIEFKAPE